jgi:hypothetical protein
MGQPGNLDLKTPTKETQTGFVAPQVRLPNFVQVNQSAKRHTALTWRFGGETLA